MPFDPDKAYEEYCLNFEQIRTCDSVYKTHKIEYENLTKMLRLIYEMRETMILASDMLREAGFVNHDMEKLIEESYEVVK